MTLRASNTTRSLTGWWPGAASRGSAWPREDVYLLDLDTLTWTRRSPAPTHIVIPTAASATGTFGRFRYIPSRNAFVVVNHVDDPVFFYCLSPGTGSLVFADGFESGSTSNGSAVVGRSLHSASGLAR